MTHRCTSVSTQAFRIARLRKRDRALSMETPYINSAHKSSVKSNLMAKPTFREVIRYNPLMDSDTGEQCHVYHDDNAGGQTPWCSGH
jgi:hypothetical protein